MKIRSEQHITATHTRSFFLFAAVAALAGWLAAPAPCRTAPAGERQTLTPAEKMLFMQSMRASSLVDGGAVEACWFEDGATFWFRDAKGLFFVDPAKKEMRNLRSEEQAAWTPKKPRSHNGRVYSPQHDRYTLIEEGDIHLYENEGGKGRRLTEDAAEDIAWSVAPEGWSTDGTRLCAVRIDTRKVHHLPIIDYSEPEEKVRKVVYGKTGGGFMRQEIALFDLESGKKTVVNARDDGEEEVYLFPLGWREDASELLFLRLARNAKRLDLLAADPGSGKSRTILTETRESFMGGLDFITGGWKGYFTSLDGTDRFLWLSERDGWRHIYLYNLEGALIRRLTEGPFPVLSVVASDVEKGRVYFLANGEKRLYDTNLYSVALDGSGFRRLTKGTGDHTVQFAPSKSCFVDTFSTPTVPPRSVLRNAAEGELLLTLSHADTTRLEASGWTPPEEFVVKADDNATDLYGLLYKPKGFDPTLKYPVIVFIYAGPFLAVVPHGFVPRSYMAARPRAAARLGFVTFIIDCRGTTERGKAFQDASYGRIGTIEIPDHVAALTQLAADRPWMDLDRVGITGASWGGYFALRAMLTAPDIFHVGIAIAPGDLTESPPINEPYMDLPENNPVGYAVGSNPAFAGNLKGRLLIIHGTADVNAPFSTTMRMAGALIRAGKLHDLAVFPQEDHYFRRTGGGYIEDLMISYFREHLATKSMK